MNTQILVTYKPDEAEQNFFPRILGQLARINFLPDRPSTDRSQLLADADIIIAKSFSQKEVDREEISHMRQVRFIQLMFAGADNIPFTLIPEKTLIASNVGGFAQPLAEHVLAMTLGLAKSILPKHKLLSEGRFDRSGFNKEIRGGICGIIGFGGNAKAIADLMRAMGMKVYGINRSGKTDALVDFMGTVNDLPQVLKASDVIVLTVPLTRETRNMIGRRELQWMKPDAILINVARGDVIDQQALYEHLKANPGFGAGIDTWWSEPDSHGAFKLEYPFFDLPNLIGSPHIADHVPESMPNATRQALENVKNYLLGQNIQGILNRQDYL